MFLATISVKVFLNLYRDVENQHILEEKLLLLENVKFLVTPKKIVIKIVNLQQSLENHSIPNEQQPADQETLRISDLHQAAGSPQIVDVQLLEESPQIIKGQQPENTPQVLHIHQPEDDSQILDVQQPQDSQLS